MDILKFYQKISQLHDGVAKRKKGFVTTLQHHLLATFNACRDAVRIRHLIGCTQDSHIKVISPAPPQKKLSLVHRNLFFMHKVALHLRNKMLQNVRYAPLANQITERIFCTFQWSVAFTEKTTCHLVFSVADCRYFVISFRHVFFNYDEL